MAWGADCGGLALTPQAIGGAKGSFPIFVTETDADIGGTVNQVIDMTTEAGDYTPADLGEGTFMICIETAAPIEVVIADGNDFTITLAQATAYTGQWYPALLKKVYKSGTTGTFSVGR